MRLETPRLILREFTAADFAWTHRISADPAVVRFMEWGPNSEAETRNFLQQVVDQQRANPRTAHTFAVEVKGQGSIGNCALNCGAQEGEAELGYVYAQSAWGQGYGAEAARALADYGFRQLDLHRIFAKCVVDNGGSYGIMEKLGMRREGHFREHRVVQGEWKDYYYYAILAREWQSGNSTG